MNVQVAFSEKIPENVSSVLSIHSEKEAAADSVLKARHLVSRFRATPSMHHAVARLTRRRFSVTRARGIRHPLTTLSVHVMVNASCSGWRWRCKPAPTVTTHVKGACANYSPGANLRGLFKARILRGRRTVDGPASRRHVRAFIGVALFRRGLTETQRVSRFVIQDCSSFTLTSPGWASHLVR